MYRGPGSPWYMAPRKIGVAIYITYTRGCAQHPRDPAKHVVIQNITNASGAHLVVEDAQVHRHAVHAERGEPAVGTFAHPPEAALTGGRPHLLGPGVLLPGVIKIEVAVQP
eukprot:1010716-Prorocentrum_minimum.AAC.1